MENIKVLRKQETETKALMVGDQISVSLDGLGDFTATAHKITDKGVLFIFDEYVISKPMNEKNTNNGGYEKSDLKKWIDSVLLEAFPAELKDRIADLSIPTVGELFGHEDEWDREHFEPDNDEQLPLMKERRNRVAYLKNELEWGWLRNATKKEVSSAYFALVNYIGYPTYGSAAYSYGVRPEFWLVR